jgi:hypothetical protein
MTHLSEVETFRAAWYAEPRTRCDFWLHSRLISTTSVPIPRVARLERCPTANA